MVAGRVPPVATIGPTGRLLITAWAATLVAFAVFPHRLEYSAHLVAGMGLAAAGVALIGWRNARSAVPEEADASATAVVGARMFVAVVAAVVVAGTLADVFVTGPFEILDVANTTMGGLLGVAVLASASGDHHLAGRRGVPLAVVGAVLVVVGLLLRYPIQSTVKHWWWFG